MSAKLEVIKNFYAQAFQALDKKREVPDIKVEFYPYIGINHTIRVRDAKVFVRIAEIFQDAPLDAQQSLALILVAKLLRKKIPPSAENIYREFVKTPEIQDKALENKRERGKKIITSAKGEVYDLEEIFARINRQYFSNCLEKPTLSWSAQNTFRRLGHHDSVHRTIIISKSLDDKKVPRFVVEFVVFHEMLHIFHPTEHRNGRRYYHTAAFRRDEEKFAHFEEAENWIELNARRLKWKAKRK